MEVLKFSLCLLSIAGIGTCFTLRQNETNINYVKQTRFVRTADVIGGAPICIERAPYQVFLSHRATDYFCGGVLIEPDIVLTAAHCVYDRVKLRPKLLVTAGTEKSKTITPTAKLTVPVAEIKLHPKYDRRYITARNNYDLAILKLEKKFKLSNKVKVIELAKSDVKENDKLDLTGYGRKDKNVLEKISCLKDYKVTAVNCEENVQSGRMKSYENVFCYKSDARANLPGYSGSPVVNANGKLAGVHSATFSNCHVGVNVFRHSKWISEMRKELNHKSDQIMSVQDMLDAIDKGISVINRE